jgi:hypothetical protein
MNYDDFQNKTFKTILFILREKWACPLCGEHRLRKVCPPEIYDWHKIGSTRYEDDERQVKQSGGTQNETLF